MRREEGRGVPFSAQDLLDWLRPATALLRPTVEELPPLVRELFGREQLELHARDLGLAQGEVRSGGRNRLLPRLADNARFIAGAHEALSRLSAGGGRVPPAGEWLLDNHHLVEEQLRIARDHLPRSYSRELPLLARGACAGLPRVYVIALEFITHVDGCIDSGMLRAFLATYQVQRPLSLGELWALPIMLRLALLESMRRVAARLLRFVADHAAAGVWAERLVSEAERAPHEVILVVADLARSGHELSTPFVAELVRRLQGQTPAVAPALSWIESSLVSRGLTTETVVLRESSQQASDQISIAHAIGSLRQLDAIDWDDFVEGQSAVERVLRGDPAAAYAAMAFPSRDRYRHAVEAIARRSPCSETEVAELAIGLAHTAQAAGEVGRSHVGAWLVAPAGLAILERTAGARRPCRQLLRDLLRAAPLTAYLGLALLFTAAAVLLLDSLVSGLAWWLRLVLGALSALAASGSALALANRLFADVVPPWPLARLDFSEGIPLQHRTVVAVPCLLGSTAGIDRLIEQLEVRWLSNRDASLTFVLLSDLRDAASQVLPGDAVLIEQARAGMQAANAAHGAHFVLLHRERAWNGLEGCWMGAERKRGKLAELNRLILSGDRSGFALVAGDADGLHGARYVLVLDADTQLPGGAAAELVGAMAHPLNRPVVDPRRSLVVAGHGLIQPRVTATLTSAGRSWYAWLGAGDAGIDPYARAVSNLYQDLFDEGSFVGKGIYDVAAFEAVFAGRMPDNRILSHDLIEGCYLRAAFDSETLLFEDVPAGYLADVARRQRWTRGDWQVARWILPRPPGATGAVPNPLSALSRWKLTDNLRRGLAPFAWTLLFGAAAIGWLGWPLLAVLFGVHLLPHVLPILGALLAGPGRAGVAAWLRQIARVAMRSSAEWLFAFTTMPFEAVWSVESVVRSTWRLLISHRHQLEWMTAADAERAARTDPAGLLAATWPGWLLGLAIAVIAIGLGTGSEWIAVCLPWLLAPLATWLAGLPRGRNGPALTTAQGLWLRLLGRRTWAWFEDHVTALDHHLPPDNTQERSEDAVAHRTSPTNLGLSLLADLASADFGWTTPTGMLARIEATITTMERLERHRGHFFNWYDTRELSVLPPRYVSTVDSGNLVGHVLVLRRGLLELAHRPLPLLAMAEGLRDTATLAEEGLGSAAADGRQRMSTALGALIAADARLPALLPPLGALCDAARALAADPAASDGEARRWTQALARDAAAWHAFLLQLAPWLLLDQPPDAACAALYHRVDQAASLRAIAGLRQELIPELAGTSNAWLARLHAAVEAGSRHAAQLLEHAARLAVRCEDLADADFTFLFDAERELLIIGCNIGEQRRDAGNYDLLASEARLVSYVGIAMGQLPQRHWFRLGRLIADCEGGRALVSWSGSMFEYLMPNLVMPDHAGTLLDATNRAMVRTQIAYGRARGVPWGVSESGYLLIDQHQNYQYRAFGVPGLGLKRGLGDDLVVAPYATVMALMIAPVEACANLERLVAEERNGPYGLYEAIDCTPSRLPRGQDSATVRQYMVHHQGMSLLALAKVLLGAPMQRRFRADLRLRASDLLLHERIPHLAGTVRLHEGEVESAQRPPEEAAATMRVLASPRVPGEVNLLSNGRYQVMVGPGGGGWSRWRDLAVTRWREDPTLEGHGLFCYLRDLESGRCWSSTYQPTQLEPDEHQAVFTQGKAEFHRVDGDIESHTEIAVSPEDDVEVRRVVLRNRSRSVRIIELTTYAEVVLAAQAADAGHPAFSNLFVQTEVIGGGSLLATRRPRRPDESPPWLVHLVNAACGEEAPPSFETDRAAFIGRGRSVVDPVALAVPGQLAGGIGCVLDPIVAIRRVLRIPAEGEVTIDVVLGMAETREAAEVLATRYRETRFAERVFQLAWTQAQVALRLLNVSERDAQLYARLAGAVVHAVPHRRAPAAVLGSNRRGQAALWVYGISGDLPIVLVRIADAERIELVRDAVQAHAWFRAKGLAVELVVLIEDPTSYRQALMDAVMGLIASGHEAAQIDRPGGIFVRRGDQLAEDDRILFQAMARVVMSDHAGTFAEQVERRPRGLAPMARLVRRPGRGDGATHPVRRDDLVFRNAHGGFTGDGREYVIVLNDGATTPAPWVNVLANEHFGTLVSERGSAYTWLENSHEYRLTPWGNDPLSDGSGEAFWIRDEDTGRFWSPTHGPAGGAGGWIVRHGLGYSVFEHRESGIASECWHYVAADAPVKIVSIRLRNLGSRTRRVAVAGYWEWVLGELRGPNHLHIVTEIDGRSGALLARNPYHPDFPERIAFVDCSEQRRSCTGDRAEMIGRGGSLERPCGLTQVQLSDRVGAGLDPCAALLVPVELPPGEEREIVFVLGVGSDADDVQQLIQRFRGVGSARRTLEQVWEHWKRHVGAIQVETPDPSVDVLANGWLPYQVLACRFWARTGFYQSGGAFGFRDQLQDSMALLPAAPGLVRAHLLRAAARQFREGDVQHWWHPPADRGVRTRISDDYLWLPYVAAHYALTTADTGVFDEQVPFIEGRPLRPDEESCFDRPLATSDRASLYEHCRLALDRACGLLGPHALPLIGGGDWNDGMNLVGEHGKGESVWLGWFLADCLRRFAPVAQARGDLDAAERWRKAATALAAAIEAEAWDGDWYRRAWFDDGRVLGSIESAECRIDSLPQSWAVLSGAGDPTRALQALGQVDARLVDRQARLIRLFDPPFDSSDLEPGYIKGYAPGVRENGGQYTHAAIWVAMAFARVGHAAKAWELFALLNPVTHGGSPEASAVYRVEPYVVAADIYGVAPHIGRGGWTWYTGSAGWLHRLLIEELLGVRREGDRLLLSPRPPPGWHGYTVHYRHHRTTYHIVVTCAGGDVTLRRMRIDGVDAPVGVVPLVDDGRDHRVEVELGASA